jgi:hypothetical protein
MDKRSPGTTPYVPSLGDFMGATQLRHFKLSYAGQLKNWQLADYEIEQIRQSFENARALYPRLANVDMAEMIVTESYAPLDALKKAVANRGVVAHWSGTRSRVLSRFDRNAHGDVAEPRSIDNRTIRG